MRGSKIAKGIEEDRAKPVKTVNEWLTRTDIEKWFTIANAKFRHDYRRLRVELRKQSAYLYFIGVQMGNHSVTKMMYSTSKQAKFCSSVIYELGQKKVDEENYNVFFKDVKNIENRLKTIERITKENIHLTEYEPFFEAEIYGLDDINLDFEQIPAMAKEWNENHKDEVQKHMEAVAPEIKRHDDFLKKKQDEIKAEKEAKKKAKKEEDDYIREMKKNREKHKKEYNRIERSFEKYYNGGI